MSGIIPATFRVSTHVTHIIRALPFIFFKTNIFVRMAGQTITAALSAKAS